MKSNPVHSIGQDKNCCDGIGGLPGAPFEKSRIVLSRKCGSAKFRLQRGHHAEHYSFHFNRTYPHVAAGHLRWLARPFSPEAKGNAGYLRSSPSAVPPTTGAVLPTRAGRSLRTGTDFSVVPACTKRMTVLVFHRSPNSFTACLHPEVSYTWCCFEI